MLTANDFLPEFAVRPGIGREQIPARLPASSAELTDEATKDVEEGRTRGSDREMLPHGVVIECDPT